MTNSPSYQNYKRMLIMALGGLLMITVALLNMRKLQIPHILGRVTIPKEVHYIESDDNQHRVTVGRIFIAATSTICLPKTLQHGKALNMETFYEALKIWNITAPFCRESMKIFRSIYEVRSSFGEMIIDSPLYKEKVVAWLGNDSNLYKQALNQSLVSIFNRFTREEAVFNPLRAKRPTPKSNINDLEYIENLTQKSAKSCDFCRYKTYTAHDRSGRLENDLAFAAANTFRFDKKHQMIISRNHHPLNWSHEEFMAMFELANKWFDLEHSRDASYAYPIIVWDVLPHAGGSQIHPHIQIVLERNRYAGLVEGWVMAAREYYKVFNRNYFTDLIRVHDSLGLTVRYKSAAALATLVPKRDNEVVIICKTASADFYTLLYFVIRAFIEDKEIYPFSMTAALPPLNDNSESIPAFIRIVTRGRASDVRSDISSLELFTVYNVNSDPFVLMKEIQSSVDKRSQGIG